MSNVEHIRNETNCGRRLCIRLELDSSNSAERRTAIFSLSFVISDVVVAVCLGFIMLPQLVGISSNVFYWLRRPFSPMLLRGPGQYMLLLRMLRTRRQLSGLGNSGLSLILSQSAAVPLTIGVPALLGMGYICL